MKEMVNFIMEAGMLKRSPRSGWAVVGVKDAESVAEHSFRCAVIGYLLARREKADAYRVLLMTLFGDIHEARMTDLHKMAHTYIDVQGAEDRAFADQIRSLKGELKGEMADMRTEYRAQETRESIIARDADILECLIQAREYAQQGFVQAAKFTVRAPGFLKTKSARSLWRQAKTADLNEWWTKVTRFER